MAPKSTSELEELRKLEKIVQDMLYGSLTLNEEQLNAHIIEHLKQMQRQLGKIREARK